MDREHQAGRCTRKLRELLQGTKCANERPVGGGWRVAVGCPHPLSLHLPLSPRPVRCDFGPVMLCVVQVK